MRPQQGRHLGRCTRCTGLIGGSQSGQNTTSRPRTGREVVLRMAQIFDQIFTLILPPSGESLPISFSQWRAATRWVIS
jgi:hypothetical protein